jgi:putative spermidine/putrescine transport system substrate-binding protein
VLYNPKYKGKITVPDNPIQIADAALYLSKIKPSLKITNPYELTQTQFNDAVSLLKEEHPLIKKYWDLASQEISLFQNGEAVVGAAWPYQTNTLIAAGAKVADTIPSQGATGWADTWLLATHAPDPNCAYKWMAYVSTPKIQAEEADYFGETPGQHAGLSDHEHHPKGLVRGVPRQRPRGLFLDHQVLADAAGGLRQRQERLR